jgi:MerR family transcriptional regulator, light-induced transcriptional regulator
MTNTYTIKDLAQLSRIKPHTLRIWEQRYGILKPQRSDSNIRQYNQEELKYLLNIAILYENGFKISQIARLTQADLSQEVRRLTDHHLQYPSHVQNLVLAMLDLDEDRFNRQLTTNIMSFGMEETVLQIIYPFLSHIGVLWQTNTINPAQEHFITYLIRQKLIVAIDGITNERLKPNPRKIILFLPEGELHEISLLFACFMVKHLGHKCIYLGQSLPLIDLAAVQNEHKADVIFTIITSTPCQEDVLPYVKKMKESLPSGEVWLTGYQVCSQELELPPNFKVINNTSELKTLLV